MGRQYFLRKSLCPVCREIAGIPIHYGVPNPALYELVERGDIVVSDSAPTPGAPEWACRKCGHQWSGGEER